MEATKMTTEKIYEKIAEHIKQQILTGSIKPGEKLPSDKELCQLYSVGRSTIREAMSALKILGLLESRQGEGSYVKMFNSKDVKMPDFKGFLLSEEAILELMEARKSLELSNVELAAQKRTEEDLKKFEQILHQMEHNLINEDESEKADMLFHRTLAEATQNSIMVRLLGTISEQMEKAMKEIRRIGFSDISTANRLLKEHKEIYEAIVQKDVEKAFKSMKNHLEHFENELRNHMKTEKNNL